MRFQNKLFLIFATYSMLLVLAIVVLVQIGLKQGLLDYVNARAVGEYESAVDALAFEYKTTGSWQRIAQRPGTFKRIMDASIHQKNTSQSDFAGDPQPPLHQSPRRQGPRDDRLGPPGRISGPPGRNFMPPHILLDSEKIPVMGPMRPINDYSLAPIVVEATVVGYFGIRSQDRLTEGYDLQFSEQFQDYTLWLGLVLLLVSAVVAGPISRHITRPLRQITAKIENVKNGHYEDLMSLKRKDEIGVLSKDIDLMAEKLAHSKTARERWLADVSHELRTPLAVLLAQIESIEDGIRVADEENLNAMRNEVLRCQNLMADLHEISMPEPALHRYHFELCHIGEWLHHSITRHDKRFKDANVNVTLNLPTPDIEAEIDKNRMMQLVDNLINNVFNYAQASQLTASAHVLGNALKIVLEDNGVGVEEDEYDALFSYQFRGRRQKHSVAGSGIGLALCSKIAQAHGGTISAAPSVMGGLKVTLSLPNQDE